MKKNMLLLTDWKPYVSWGGGGGWDPWGGCDTVH